MSFEAAAWRTLLAERVNARRSEIEVAALARVRAVSDPDEIADPEYAAGLREAVTAALGYGIAGIELTDPESAFIPEQLRAQARRAACAGVSLDTVLRRYFAGYTLLNNFIVQETEGEEETPSSEMQSMLRTEAALFDRLVASVSDAYACEGQDRPRSVEQRRIERIKKLLSGELIDPPDFAYELDGWHLGAIASGPGSREAVRGLAAALDCQLLAVCAEAGTIWAWLGGRRKTSAREVLRLAKSCWPDGALLALGESEQGLEGWSLTHRQAKAATAVARHGWPSPVRYSDVALLAAALRDDVLARSLRNAYLAPLERGRDGGAVLLQTLEAYFLAGRNASSAAAALGKSRNTVSIRLRSVEEIIDRPVDHCAAELEIALRLRELATLH